MSDLPVPMTPADCDLRGLPFMPLDVVRLIDSDLFALSSGDEFKAAVCLWCKSWLQVPAGSLPDDDRILAHLSGSGSRWLRLRPMALRGWVKCSDGRLYHSVIAIKACEAWKGRLAQRARAHKRWNGNAGSHEQSDPIAPAPAEPRQSPGNATAYATASAPAMQGRGRGTEEVEIRKDAAHPREIDGCELAVAAWNSMAAKNGLSCVTKLTDTRKRSLKQRLGECGGVEGWNNAIRLIPQSEFLLGHRSDWKATFDFIIESRNFTKLVEGNYSNRGRGPKPKQDNMSWMAGPQNDQSDTFPTIDQEWPL